jgi:hypothetical protein
VQTDAPENPLMRLIITFEAVASIVATPRLRLNLSTVVGEEATARVLLHSVDGHALEITANEGDLPRGLEIGTRSVTDSESVENGTEAVKGDVWLEARMSPQDEPSRWSGKLHLSTNLEQARYLEVPVAIWVQPLLEVRPPRARIKLMDKLSETRFVTLRVINTLGEKFEISKIESSHPDVFVGTVLTEAERKNHTLRIAPAEGLEPLDFDNPINGTIRVHTNIEKRSLIEIPVSVKPSQYRRPRPYGRTPTPGIG